MKYAGFATVGAALDWRKRHGGWIFHATTGEAIWFANPATPTPIMLHRATRGLSGKLL